MKKLVSIAATCALCLCVAAQETILVSSFRYSGPLEIAEPARIDSLDSSFKAFDPVTLLDCNLSSGVLKDAGTASSVTVSGKAALHLLGFKLDCSGFSKVKISVETLLKNNIYVDGGKLSGTEAKLEPGTHEVTVKCLSFQGDAGEISISVERITGCMPVLRENEGRLYSLTLNSDGDACSGVSLSADGKLLATDHRMVLDGGERSGWSEIIRLEDGKVVERCSERVRWMPDGCRRWFTRKGTEGRNLMALDPLTGEEELLCAGIPEGEFEPVPGGRYLIYTLEKKGPREGDVHQILTPEDRQPGWRDRNYLALFDMQTSLMQPLTFGYRDVRLCDISRDGSKLVFCAYGSKYGPRPTEKYSYYLTDLRNLESRLLVDREGFVQTASFSPDGNRLLLTGSPEAFGGIGNVTPKKKTPSMYDLQLFVMDIRDGSVKPLTKDFTPSVDRAQWSSYDGRICLTVEVKDCVTLYCLNPTDGSFTKIETGEDKVSGFSIAEKAPMVAWYGQSLENGDRVYTYEILRRKLKTVEDFSAKRFSGVEFGQGNAWEFKTSRGDLINAFYVLPPGFDPHKKYPMIVHYYGGCSPTVRYCVGSYSPQLYAAQGYVFLVINPSGAAGFGQEFSSRHVNTAGDVVADDIIEGTKRFCAEHPFVDSRKVGCFSASYGGFMTQLLLSKTSFFATGISHAGISDHTSYWGEGFWGYSYSEVCMAGNYPWTNKSLYVDHSPLYNADKIHTPLLFLHGSADTNVPIGESIQMFTALKLLGQDTAFVVVDDENHGIADYSKKKDWLRTISAWFSKYLKDDPSWWDELYPAKKL